MNYFFKPFFYFIQFLPSDSYKPFLSWCELFTQLLHSVACGRKGSGLGKDVHDATYSFLVTIKLYGINCESLQNTSRWIYSCCFYLMICVSLFTATLRVCSFRRIQKRIFDPRFARFRGRKEREIRNWICNLGNLSPTRAICTTASQKMTCFLPFDKLCDYAVRI